MSTHIHTKEAKRADKQLRKQLRRASRKENKYVNLSPEPLR